MNVMVLYLCAFYKISPRMFHIYLSEVLIWKSSSFSSSTKTFSYMTQSKLNKQYSEKCLVQEIRLKKNRKTVAFKVYAEFFWNTCLIKEVHHFS
jgi:hypothetical protein